jgi:hypothetical protein
MSWVIEKSAQKGSNLLVLLMIANHANTAGDNAYPAVTTLAAESRLSERAVRYILAKLEHSSELVIRRDAGPYGTHLYSLPGVTLDGFNLRGLPANFAGRKQQGKAAGSANLPARSGISSGKSFAPEPKRAETKSQNLRPLTRPSSTVCGKVESIVSLARAKSVTPVWKTQKELDERRQFLHEQCETIQKQFQSAG